MRLQRCEQLDRWGFGQHCKTVALALISGSLQRVLSRGTARSTASLTRITLAAISRIDYRLAGVKTGRPVRKFL